MRLKDETKRKQIIECTLDMVHQTGLSGLKMAALARKVGLSPATLYIYFKNKEDLVLSVYDEVLGTQEVFLKAHTAEPIPIRAKLKKVWLQWFHFSINNIKEKSFIEQVKQSPYYKKQEIHDRGEAYSLVSALFQTAKTEGMVKALDNEVLIAATMASLTMSAQLVRDGKMALKDSNQLFDLYWDGIKR